MTPTPLNGSLGETNVPTLLLDLYRDHYSGALVLESQRTRKKILFHEGAPVAAESDLKSESLCVLLLSKGTLSQADVAQVEQSMSRNQYDESRALLDVGLLKPKDLFTALKELVRRRTIACFAWLEGSYRLDPADAPADNIQSFRADPLALVQEGLETAWGVDRMLETLAQRMDRFPVATPALSAATSRLNTDQATDEMLRRLDGSSSLSEVLGCAVRSPRALAAAWVIDASGLLRYRETPLHQNNDGEEPEIEIEIAGLPDPTDPVPDKTKQGPNAIAAVAPGKAHKAAEADEPGKAHQADKAEQAEAMRGEILERLEVLSKLDFYQLLEVDRNAKGVVVKKAYFKAAKRYHPDALARLGLGALKQEAAAVFSRIAEAYEILSNAEKRSGYDAALDSDGPEIDTASLAQAETFFQKGEILARMGDFRGALQFLENAVQLWPEECAYQSLLGWALYKKNPSEPERAREHLEKALELDSKDSEVHFRRGLVLRALGETEAAKESLARAKQLDPGSAK